MPAPGLRILRNRESHAATSADSMTGPDDFARSIITMLFTPSRMNSAASAPADIRRMLASADRRECVPTSRGTLVLTGRSFDATEGLRRRGDWPATRVLPDANERGPRCSTGHRRPSSLSAIGRRELPHLRRAAPGATPRKGRGAPQSPRARGSNNFAIHKWLVQSGLIFADRARETRECDQHSRAALNGQGVSGDRRGNRWPDSNVTLKPRESDRPFLPA
jgi:hypothetical protein